MNGRSLAELEETEKYGLGGRDGGASLSIFFWMQGSAAAATVGSPVGKISAALWSGVEPAITINERKRPVRAHKGKKIQSQTKNKGRDGGKERGREGNNT